MEKHVFDEVAVAVVNRIMKIKKSFKIAEDMVLNLFYRRRLIICYIRMHKHACFSNYSRSRANNVEFKRQIKRF